MKHEESPNHTFILSVLRDEGISGEVLDFGCGTGAFVSLARANGVSCHGADSYETIWSHWQNEILPGAVGAVSRIVDGRLPYPDAHFEAVISNQVFEHIKPEMLPGVVSEISRVMAPGGIFLLLYPPYEIWFEPHLRILFPHRFSAGPMQRGWLSLNYALGWAGKQPQPRDEWVNSAGVILASHVFYHRQRRITAMINEALGSTDDDLGAHYVADRLSELGIPQSLARHGWLAPIRRVIAIKRAGVVQIFRRRTDASKISGHARPE